MASTPPPKLLDLSNEIIFLIVEKLDALAPASLFKLRLVSKRSDALVVPILYRSATLNPLLFPHRGHDELSSTIREHILTNIRAHTRQLTIRTTIDWKKVLDFMMTMIQFTTLR